ncbi:MAG: ATP-dependent Clp protease ATP-binding subunit [Abditibacteriota bacterium]|nr:ATP-dependent Clp protease ATP-binding subunit [Abditibacteriota bacterium]
MDPCVGRDAETERLIQILARKNKNNACLLGEAGVGKTAIVEGLAQRIAQNNVPDMLKGVHIYSLDLGSLIAGTRFRGDFEERLKSIMQDIKKMGDKAIVFLDEIHTVMGAGSTGGNDLDASNILKPALSKGEFRLIGATTPKEYRNSIEKDPAFERRIQTIAIKEPTKAETLKILEGIVHGFEAFHNVTVNHSTLKLCVDLSDMYITDKYQPDKSIDVLDEACAKAKLKFKSQVTDKDIYSTVETMTGIPMSKLTQTENEKLLSLEREFKKRIVGQEKAIDVLCKTIRRNRVGLRDSSRPIGSFIFLGPTGVGKTELAKTLAQVLFGSDKNIIRFDMSEYMEKHTVSRLIGAAPGYIGYEEGGQLTELVKRRPYSVILFDEIEKAHNDVYNVLLQVLDDGRLTDNVGRVVDFKNTIIIFTGNIGSGYISNNDKVGFISSKDDMEKAIKTNINQGVKNTFKPEFLNRIDDLIIFDSLTEEDCKKIVKLMLSDLLKSLSEKNIKVTVSEGACDFLAKKGTSRQFGARPLRKTIQKYIEDPLSEEILNNKLVSGKTLNISLSKDKIVFKYKENKKLVMNNA